LQTNLQLALDFRLKRKLKPTFEPMLTPKPKPRFKLKPKPRLSRDTMGNTNLLYRHTILFNIISR
jgi:hypothetical protein